MKRYQPLFEDTHPYYVKEYIDKRADWRSNFYKDLKEGEEIPWGPTYKPLFEAVIRSDRYVLIVIDELRQFLKENAGKSFKYAFQVCVLLSKFFHKYNFEFIEKNERSSDFHSGIDEAKTLPSNFKITFYCNMALNNLFVDEELQKNFLISFDELLGHELIHRGQFLNKQDEIIRVDIFKLKQVKGNQHNKDMYYYSLKGEIMAYAWMAVEELRFNGYSTKRILEIIKTNEPLKKESPVLKIYRELFTIDDAQLKRLYKYMYEYILDKNYTIPSELNIIGGDTL